VAIVGEQRLESGRYSKPIYEAIQRLRVVLVQALNAP